MLIAITILVAIAGVALALRGRRTGIDRYIDSMVDRGVFRAEDGVVSRVAVPRRYLDVLRTLSDMAELHAESAGCAGGIRAMCSAVDMAPDEDGSGIISVGAFSRGVEDITSALRIYRTDADVRNDYRTVRGGEGDDFQKCVPPDQQVC